jgi:hypothetical protein
MSSQLSAQWAEPPWGAEPRFELGPALQQASALPTEPHCTLEKNVYMEIKLVQSFLLFCNNLSSQFCSL